MTPSNEKLFGEKLKAAKTRRLQMQHLNAIEGNPLDELDIEMFKMFEREGWSHEQCLAHILNKTNKKTSAAE